MKDDELFNDLQGVLDAMQDAVGQCAAEEIAVEEMWTELDALCQKLAALSAGDTDEDDEDEDEDADEDAPADLNFDEDEDEKGVDEDDDETLN